MGDSELLFTFGGRKTFVMDVKELRIGNWIEEYFVNSVVISVTSEHYGDGQIRLAHSVENYPRNIVQARVCNPIPLTKEWFENFGFKYYKGNSRGYYVMRYGNRVKFRFIKHHDCYMIDGHNAKIKYVHQLQNLYFALTGEELEIQKPAQ